MRILIVEDSPTQAQELRLVLESEGFEVDTAPDAEQGLALLRASPVDLVLSDILMPGLSGYDLCQRIKADPVHQQTPVILLTALDDPEDIIRGLACDADGFLTKPCPPDLLLGRIQQTLANKLRRTGGEPRSGTEVLFHGKQFTITSGKEQVLDFLLATYEDAVRTNRELRESRMELAEAKVKVEHYARLLEGRVRSSEEKYRQLMEQAGDAILLLDLSGKVLEVNRRGWELLGRPWDNVVGRPYADFIPDAERGSVQAQLQQLPVKGLFHLANVHLLRGDGRQVDVDFSASLVEVGGERVVLAIARDVTTRNRLEQQLRQASKLEALGQMAGGVAHDFNNLLTVILGSGDIQLSVLPPGEPAHELATEIKEAGERGAALTRQLLAFSRQQPVAPKLLDLNAVVGSARKILARLIGGDIELNLVAGPALDAVLADPGQIEQVLMNLAVNGRDAMPKGGKLTIETGNVKLDEGYAQSHPGVWPGPHVLLRVTDTGSGMDEATRARLFEPFFTTKGDKGTGLGLATVYGIVQQSGGHIAVESAPGRGTTFKVYLPRAPEAATAGRQEEGKEREEPGRAADTLDLPLGSIPPHRGEDESQP